jgi:anti-sigma regulatory factor (Ser/Thr protein kinase)
VAPPGDFVFRSWPACPDQLAAIRAEARGWLATLELSDGSREDMVLAISEAATNAIVHGNRPARPGSVDVTFWTEPNALCVEVADAGSAGPPNDAGQAGTPDGAGLAGQPIRDGLMNGMGISIMRRMVESVLIRFDRSGTRVLLRQPLPAAR